MKIHAFFFFLLILCSNIFSVSIYKKIQPINEASLTWEDEEWPNEPFGDYVKRCLEYQINLQKIKKRRIVFKMFDAQCKQELEKQNSLYDMNSIQDLGLLAGEENETYIAEIIDRTQTELGKVFFYGLLSNPTNNIAVLESRQAIIKYFINNSEFHSQLRELYNQCAVCENLVLSLWTQDGFLNATQRHYFSLPFSTKLNNYLNRKAVPLELKSVWDHHQRALFFATGVLAAIVLPLYGIKTYFNKPCSPFFEKIAQRLQGSGGKIIALLSSFSDHKAAIASSAIAAGVTCTFASKEEFDWAKDNIILDLCLHQKMILIAQFFNTIGQIDQLLESHPEFLPLCPAAARINAFLKESMQDPELKKLFELLQSDTFQGNPSFFSFHGRILAAYKIIYELKSKIEPLLFALGQLDAFSSCATLYNEFLDKKVHFCFAEFVTNSQPSILLEEFWNPYINPDKVVPNSIDLQGPTKRNMIITGPNAGGKSTVIKAIPLNLIFAQSIGLAAASRAVITPFYSIATYLNIVDDIASGNSLFKAQVLRAQEMINLIQTTPQGQLSFVALDEMFNGTSAKESKALAYSVVKYLGQYTNNISIVATHFPLLTNLAQDDPAFENYKVSVDINETAIHYPFKLEKGISNQHIALDILLFEGYDSTIIAQAAQILNEV